MKIFFAKKLVSKFPKRTRIQFQIHGYRSVINIDQNLSRIRTRIYTLDKYNLQTKITSFPDQENLPKQVVVRLEIFTNISGA